MWESIKTWFKKYWAWILFPVGILLLILKWRQREIKPVDPPSTAEIVRQIKVAVDKKEEQLRLLEEKYQDKLAQLSQAQKEEFERVKDLPLEAVADWIDQIQ